MTAHEHDSGSDDHAPKTAGELRRLLARKGIKWQVDPRLRDDDRLIVYPRGGIMQKLISGAERCTGDLVDYLRRVPPNNPFLRARWLELGILLEPDARGSAGSTPRDGTTIQATSGKEAS